MYAYMHVSHLIMTSSTTIMMIMMTTTIVAPATAGSIGEPALNI